MSSAGQPQDLARHNANFPLDDSVVRLLVAALTLPATCPEPSAHVDDEFNVAFRALLLLAKHLCSLSPTANAWTEALMEQLVESLIAFILYYVREIVLCGKIVDFRDAAGHDFHNVVLQVHGALIKHPFVRTGHPKSKAYDIKLQIFLADIIPALLLTHDAVDSTRTASPVSLLFVLMRCLGSQALSDRLHHNFFQILDQNPAMTDALASAFLIAINEFRVGLTSRPPSQAVTAQDHCSTSLSICFVYRFIPPFFRYHDLYDRLLQGGYTRTTCELFAAVLQEVRAVILAVPDTDKAMVLSLGGKTREQLGQHIITRLKSEGRARVELVLHYDVLYQMRELDRLLHKLGTEIEIQDAVTLQQNLQDGLIHVLKPYLVYHDILQMVSKRIIRSECTQESDVWKTFAREIESLEGDRTAFDEVYRESCQAQDCPHSYTKSPLQTALHRSPTTLSELDLLKLARANSESHFTLFRCSGCRLVYYCSADCQQGDWKEHKSVCASVKRDRKRTGGPTNVLSRRDITFMDTVVCLTLSRHPPPDGLVQDMDFITFPPTLTLRSLDNIIYDDAKIVVGEKEIHKDVIRKRALNYMRSQGEEVGIVYSRRFLPEGAKAVLTFVDWEMLDGQGIKYKRRG